MKTINQFFSQMQQTTHPTVPLGALLEAAVVLPAEHVLTVCGVHGQRPGQGLLHRGVPHQGRHCRPRWWQPEGKAMRLVAVSVSRVIGCLVYLRRLIKT